MELFFALLLTLSNIKHKALITFMFLIPILIPAQITAISWQEFVSPSGPLSEIYKFFHIQSFSNPLYSKGGVMLLLSIKLAALFF